MAGEVKRVDAAGKPKPPKEDAVQQAADDATRDTSWPDWYEQMSDGEEGKIKCGSMGDVRIEPASALVDVASARIATEESPDPELLVDWYVLMLEAVTQWDEEKWGKLFRDVPAEERAEEFNKRAKDGKLKSKWINRIQQGVQLLAKN